MKQVVNHHVSTLSSGATENGGEPSAAEALHKENLTSQDYWDACWRSIQLPQIVSRGSNDAFLAGIVGTFDRFFPKGKLRTALEIGGAPGKFLAFCTREYGCEAHVLDYSDVGCRMAAENFRLLGLPVVVHQQDLFDTSKTLPQFDFVYSLGVIEHFQDTERVVERHWRMVKPGGVLLLGVPHFVRVFWPVLRFLAPQVTQGHNRQSLDLERWRPWERALGMRVLHRAYLGGFEPMLIRTVIDEEHRLHHRGLAFLPSVVSFALWCVGALRGCLYRLAPGLRRLQSFNSRRFSSYALTVYRKQGGEGVSELDTK